MPTITAHPFGTPSWFDHMSRDAAATRAFYSKVLGWEYDLSGPEYGYYAMARRGGNQTAGIGQMREEDNYPPAWTVYFNTERLEDTIAKIQEHGGSVAVPPMDVPPSGRLAVCMDPTNAVFGLWQPLEHKGAGLVNEPGAMSWCEVNTRDAAKARDFYCNVFGLEAQQMDDPKVTYYMLGKPGSDPCCGVMQMTAEWGEMPPHWMTYFAVENAEAAAELVKANGGAVHHGPFDSPYGRIVVAADPSGAAVSFIQLASG